MVVATWCGMDGSLETDGLEWRLSLVLLGVRALLGAISDAAGCKDLKEDATTTPKAHLIEWHTDLTLKTLFLRIDRRVCELLGVWLSWLGMRGYGCDRAEFCDSNLEN